MKVLKALLIRTCMAVITIYVLKCEISTPEEDDLIFLTILTAFTSMWITDLSVVRGRSCMLNFVLLLISAILLFQAYSYLRVTKTMTEGNKKHQMLDVILPCINVCHIYHWLCYELKCVVTFLNNFIRLLGLRAIRIGGYVIFLATHAVLMLFIVDAILFTVLVTVYIPLMDNFFYTFDVNNTKAYPDGYLDPLVLDRTLYNKPTVTTETSIFAFSSLHFEKYTLPEQPHFISSPKYPLSHEGFYRYIGEDVEFTCDYTLLTPNGRHPNSPVWYFNSSALLYTHMSRINVINTFEQPENTLIYNYDVISKLKIRSLQQSDFGEYTCITHLNQEAEKTMILSSGKNVIKAQKVTKITVEVFNLNQLLPSPKIIYRVVGNLIASENYFWLHSNDEDDDIYFVYTINDKPVDEVCPGYQNQMCSVGAFFIRTVISVGAERFDWDGYTGFPYIDIDAVHTTGVKRGIVYFCLCSSGFGIHRVSFMRKITINNRIRQEEIVHPHVFIVLPLSEISIFRYYDDTHLYQNIEELVKSGANLDIIETEVHDYLMYIAANENKVLGIANIVQSAILVSVIFILAGVLSFCTMVYCSMFVYRPALFIIGMKMLQNAQPIPAVAFEKFNVYLSHSEDEYDFVSNIILPFLEDELHLKVCFPNRDFHQGKSIFASYVESITNSRKIIVVISRAFMADPTCYGLQLENIILPMLYEEKRNNRNILLIKYDTDCRLPQPLRWNFDVGVYQWTDQLPLRVKLKDIGRWLRTGHL